MPETFFVTKGSGASINNAGYPLGVDDGPIFSSGSVTAVQISGALHSLTNAGGWGTTAVGDYILFDPTGTRRWCRVVQLAYGGDSNVIAVNSLHGSATIAASGKTANVGGAFSTISAIQQMFASLDGGVSASSQNNYQAGDTTILVTEINVQTSNIGGSQIIDYSEAGNTYFGNVTRWSNNSTFIYRGYRTTPGDIDPFTSFDRVCVEFTGTTNARLGLNENLNVYWYNFHVQTAQIATSIFAHGTSIGCGTFVNCFGFGTNPAFNQSIFSGSNINTIRCYAQLPVNTNNTGFNGGSSFRCIAVGTAGLENALNHRGWTTGTQGGLAVECMVIGFRIGFECSAVKCAAIRCRTPFRFDSLGKFGLYNRAIECGDNANATNRPTLLAFTTYDETTIPKTQSHPLTDIVDVPIAGMVQDYAAGDYRPLPESPDFRLSNISFPLPGNVWETYQTSGPLDIVGGGGGPMGFPLSRILN